MNVPSSSHKINATKDSINETNIKFTDTRSMKSLNAGNGKNSANTEGNTKAPMSQEYAFSVQIREGIPREMPLNICKRPSITLSGKI